MKYEDFERAKQIAAETGEDISVVLVRLGLADVRAVMQAKAQAMGYGFADLDRIVPDPIAYSMLSGDLARKWRVLPVKVDRSTMWLAMEDPAQIQRIEFVRQATACRVVPVLVLSDALTDALQRIYPAPA